MTDELKTKIASIRAGLEGVTPGPWELDKFASYIWAPFEKGGKFPILDDIGKDDKVARLRGWGHYTGDGLHALRLSPEEAVKHQRLLGEHIAHCDPGTIKAILDALEASEARVKELEEVLAPLARERCAASGLHEHDGCSCSDSELLNAATP